MTFRFFLLTTSLLAGCAGETVDVERAELVLSPDRWLGSHVRVQDPALVARLSSTTRACPDLPEGEACNGAIGGFVLVEAGQTLPLLPAEGFMASERASGASPVVGFGMPAGTYLGCHGNELEVVCAPGVPARIREVTGTILESASGYVLEVDDVRLAESPMMQDGRPALVDVEAR